MVNFLQGFYKSAFNVIQKSKIKSAIDCPLNTQNMFYTWSGVLRATAFKRALKIGLNGIYMVNFWQKWTIISSKKVCPKEKLLHFLVLERLGLLAGRMACQQEIIGRSYKYSYWQTIQSANKHLLF